MPDLSAIRDLVLEVNRFAHGVDGVVTRPAPEDTPIEARVIWITHLTEETPANSDLQRHAPRRVMALSLSQVPTVPYGTRVVAPERAGESDRNWFVEGIERREADHVRVYVLPDLQQDEVDA
jgi:hypothetical protein